MFNLSNKVFVLTGASQGIGKEMAKFLVNEGAKVALIARNKDKLSLLEKELNHSHDIRRAYAFSLDLTNVSSIATTMDKIYECFGSIDVLINNAGINITKPAEDITEDDWDNVLDLNLKSVFFCCQAAGKYLKESKNGKIITISSQMAAVGYFDRSAYCSSKGGVTQLTKALAIEWAEDGVNVNAIAPTFIETPLTAPMLEDKNFKDDVMSRIPLKRLATPEDLFGAIVFLSTSASDMVTGQTIFVDGGWTVW